MSDKPKLLSGGNPQIAKGYGDAPVQAWIAAAPGWTSTVSARIDALVVQALPEVRKAVKWNSPLYGVEEGRYFMGLHIFKNYVKVTFFSGALFDPPPPDPSTQKTVRSLNVREDHELDEAQFMDWVKQAAALPGEKM